MTIELMATLDEMKDEERIAYRDRVYGADPGAWDKLDAALDAASDLRARVKGGAAEFTRDDVIVALNSCETTRVMTHVILSLAVANLDRARENLRSASCSYCEWKYTDETWDWPEGREITSEEIKAADDRIKAEIRTHVPVCLKHPMRKLETVVEENFGDAERWRTLLSSAHVISQGNFHLTVGVRDGNHVADDSDEIRAFVDDIRAKRLTDSQPTNAASK